MTWYIAGSTQFRVNSIRIFFTHVNSDLYTWYSSLLSPFTFIHWVFMNSCRIKLFLFIELISWCCFHFSGVHIKISKWQIPFEKLCVKFPRKSFWILQSIKKKVDDIIWYKTIWKEIKLTWFCWIPFLYKKCMKFTKDIEKMNWKALADNAHICIFKFDLRE